MAAHVGQQGRRVAVGVVVALVLALGTVATGAPAEAATRTASTTCSASWHTGVRYCAGDIRGVRGTAYGTRARVVLHGVNVVDVTATTVTVMGWSACPPGTWCGALLDTLTVSWSGSGRPRYGDVISLYGVTATATLRPVAAVVTGYCDPDLGC